jgi:hypothetical protein
VSTRRRPRGLSLALPALVVAVACNKAPAREALETAERALAAAPEIEAYLPEESRALKHELQGARASYDEGQYTAALRAAQPLPDRIAAAAREAARRKQFAITAWNDLATRVPALLSAIVARLTTLAPTDGSPPGERLAASQAELAALTEGWTGANASLEKGEIATAVGAGRDVRTRAQTLATRVGVRLLPSGLPAPAPSPRPAAIPAAAPAAPAAPPPGAPPTTDATPAPTPTPTPPPS